MDATIKILIVDNYKLFAEGVVSLLSSEPDLVVTGIATSAEECLRLAKSVSPDTVLLDIAVPDSCEVDIVSEIKQINPGIGIVILTGPDPLGYIDASLARGASGFLLKDCTKEEMVTAVRRAAQDKGCIRQNMAPYPKATIIKENSYEYNPDSNHHGHELSTLTPREWEVLQLMAEGLRNKEIAERLKIARRTVEYHNTNIMGKLSVKSRSEAVVVYMKIKLADSKK